MRDEDDRFVDGAADHAAFISARERFLAALRADAESRRLESAWELACDADDVTAR
jgi:hypothetical protein